MVVNERRQRIILASGFGGFGESMNRSAIATLVQSVSKHKDTEEFKATLKHITERLEHNEGNYKEYFRYYMAQALFQGDYTAWQKWNAGIVRALSESQGADGAIERCRSDERRQRSTRPARHHLNLTGTSLVRQPLGDLRVGEPRILFVDEPTGSLDEESGGVIIDLLFEMNRRLGSTLILVTHDPNLASRCARQIKLVRGLIDT